MKLVAQRRLTVAFIVFATILITRIATAQDAAHVNSNDLEVVTSGHLKSKNGQLTLFRIYKAPDGAEGQVHYTKFDSLEAAELEIEKWVKATRTVTSREHNLRRGGLLISDRVLAVADSLKSGRNEFVIIRRDYMNCYLIESDSMQVAAQIEGLIGQN